MTESTRAEKDASFVVRRVIHAPAERVWRAWVDPELVKQWWGPEGWTCPVAEMNVAVGESSLVAMRGPDGTDYYNLWTYTAVEPGERLEYNVTFALPDGTEVPPSEVGLPADIPTPVPHVVTLNAQDGVTTLTVAEFGYESGPLRDMSRAGQEQCMDRLVRAVAAS